MSRFLVWSDLHNEFWNDIPEIPGEARDVDALLLAGDTWTEGRHVDAALLLWDDLRKPVVMVRGNHEFYGSAIDELIEEDTRRVAGMNAAGADIRLLDGSATEVAGTRIIGATLWTDMALYPGYDMLARRAVKTGMNDFRQIRSSGSKRLDVGDWLDMHWTDRTAVLDLARSSFDGPTIVMTHHIPVRDMIHPERNRGLIHQVVGNAGFASNMRREISDLEIDHWICGHSHDNCSAMVPARNGDIPVTANARGYPGENNTFDPGYILDVPRAPTQRFSNLMPDPD